MREKSASFPDASVWSIWSVSFVWLNESNQMNQRDQIDQTDQINRSLLRRLWFHDLMQKLSRLALNC